MDGEQASGSVRSRRLHVQPSKVYYSVLLPDGRPVWNLAPTARVPLAGGEHLVQSQCFAIFSDTRGPLLRKCAWIDVL